MLYLLFSLFRRIFQFAAFWVHFQHSAVADWAFYHQRTALKVKATVLCSSAGPSIRWGRDLQSTRSELCWVCSWKNSSHFGKCELQLWCICLLHLAVVIWKYSRIVSPIVLLFIWASWGFVALLLLLLLCLQMSMCWLAGLLFPSSPAEKLHREDKVKTNMLLHEIYSYKRLIYFINL